MEVNYQPPIKVTLNQVTNTMMSLSDNAKHWFIGGSRSFAVALKLLQEGKIIAIPTDTIYGLATLAQNSDSVAQLYELKGRDYSKPLAICVSSIRDIPCWADNTHLPKNLLLSLLPGPVTVVLKRLPSLNTTFNPNQDTVGIRVPDSKLLRSLCKVLNQPLALTSANSSGDQSSLTPDEFSHLWPHLGGIFYKISDKKEVVESYRVGSTIVDLSEDNYFKIIRRGIGYNRTERLLRKYGLEEKDI